MKLSGGLEEFLSLYYFGVQTCKNQLFEENTRFECSFNRIEVQVIANLPSRLEKKHQTLDILLMTDFL